MFSPRKILIVTSAHLCRNPRVVKEATTLGAAGYDVTVLTVSSHRQYENADSDLAQNLPFKRVVLDMIGTSHSARLRGIMEKSLTWASRKALRSLNIELAQALGPTSALLRQARRIPADLTILHTEIPICGARALVESGRRVAVDMEDWHSEDLLPEDRRTRPLQLLRNAESIALNCASYSSTTSESMADALGGTFACPRPIVIRNVFPLHKVSRINLRSERDCPSIIWFSQTIGRGRGLESFIAAWARMRQRTQLTLLGEPRQEFVADLIGQIPAERRMDFKVEMPVPVDRLPDTLAEFDIGLALEQKSPASRDLTITNKMFQYMNAGLAIVATETLGQIEALTQAQGSGILVDMDAPDLLVSKLDALAANREQLNAMQAASRNAAESRFCWEKEQKTLIEAVEAALVA